MARSDDKDLGARIRAARLALDLSQAEVAKAVGMSVESISRAERGTITPTIWTLLEMCRVLETDIGSLVGHPAAELERSPKIERAARLMSNMSEEEVNAIVSLLETFDRRSRRRSK